ncbi:hypothetical protein [Methylobacillus sp.]|uniref:hypothetical protein n=1 Tax=Methylobacillus sp. TaxID=56818 RepID=UPI0012C2F753|nr:hypothetical protein [Methylobacillus sp.]MPS48517.1 hypothetical protein [Methylobacillus sp.]
MTTATIDPEDTIVVKFELSMNRLELHSFNKILYVAGLIQKYSPHVFAENWLYQEDFDKAAGVIEQVAKQHRISNGHMPEKKSFYQTLNLPYGWRWVCWDKDKEEHEFARPTPGNKLGGHEKFSCKESHIVDGSLLTYINMHEHKKDGTISVGEKP